MQTNKCNKFFLSFSLSFGVWQGVTLFVLVSVKCKCMCAKRWYAWEKWCCSTVSMFIFQMRMILSAFNVFNIISNWAAFSLVFAWKLNETITRWKSHSWRILSVRNAIKEIRMNNRRLCLELYIKTNNYDYIFSSYNILYRLQLLDISIWQWKQMSKRYHEKMTFFSFEYVLISIKWTTRFTYHFMIEYKQIQWNATKRNLSFELLNYYYKQKWLFLFVEKYFLVVKYFSRT